MRLKISKGLLAGAVALAGLVVAAGALASSRGIPDGDSVALHPADLSIVKTASPASTVTDGWHLVFTIVVTNLGVVPANNVTVSDPLPAGLINPSVSTTQGSCTTAVSCDLGTIAPGGTVTITIITKTHGVGRIVNTATVASTTPDVNTKNNTSSVVVDVVPSGSSSIAAPPAGHHAAAAPVLSHHSG